MSLSGANGEAWGVTKSLDMGVVRQGLSFVSRLKKRSNLKAKPQFSLGFIV